MSRLLSKRLTFINALPVLVLIWLLSTSTSARGETLTVAVASNFKQTLQALAADFRSTGEHAQRYKIAVISGASGKLFAQIKQGAPYDLFFSADLQKPQKLFETGLTTQAPLVYALGRLVLYSSESITINPDVLAQLDGKVAIANPKFAPYGLAAMEVLGRLELDQHVHARLVFGENVTQAFQYVQTKNAQLGLVALSQVKMSQMKIKLGGQHYLFDAALHRPINQAVVVLKSAKNLNNAHAFLVYLSTTQAQNLIQSHGYDTPMEQP